MRIERTRRRGLEVAAVIAVAVGVTAITASPLRANPRAWPVDLPNGERYYFFAVGGSFPDGHKLEIWKETNGLLLCSIPESPPIGHATEPSGQSGLQITPVTCDGASYAADSRVVPPPEEPPAPSPSPPSVPTTEPLVPASPAAGGSGPARGGPGEVSLAPPLAAPVTPAAVDTVTPAKPAVVTIGEVVPADAAPVANRSFGGLLTGVGAVGLLALGTQLEQLRLRRRHVGGG